PRVQAGFEGGGVVAGGEGHGRANNGRNGDCRSDARVASFSAAGSRPERCGSRIATRASLLHVVLCYIETPGPVLLPAFAQGFAGGFIGGDHLEHALEAALDRRV